MLLSVICFLILEENNSLKPVFHWRRCTFTLWGRRTIAQRELFQAIDEQQRMMLSASGQAPYGKIAGRLTLHRFPVIRKHEPGQKRAEQKSMTGFRKINFGPAVYGERVRSSFYLPKLPKISLNVKTVRRTMEEFDVMGMKVDVLLDRGFNGKTSAAL